MTAATSRLHFESAEWIAAIADALHHAQRRGLMDRDVKPQNIWYDGNGKPRLSDFGLALKKQAFGQAAQRRNEL